MIRQHQWNMLIAEDNDSQRHPTTKIMGWLPCETSRVGYPDRYAIYRFLIYQKEKMGNILIITHLKIYFWHYHRRWLMDLDRPEPTRVLSISIVCDDKIILLGLDLSAEGLSVSELKLTWVFSQIQFWLQDKIYLVCWWVWYAIYFLPWHGKKCRVWVDGTSLTMTGFI